MGAFKLSVPSAATTLIISSVGYKEAEIAINASGTMNVHLVKADQDLGDVVVVAYGTQKKTSIVSSITTIEPKVLKGPTSNMTQMLAGRVPGIISFQRSGEPGQDNASFFIRGVELLAQEK